MKPFDIFIAYLSWDDGGKTRPVLVFVLSDSVVDVYPITTKYDNKSEFVRAKYFKINDWSISGLDALSYVDTGTLISLPINALNNQIPIGELTENDKLRLLEFFNS